LARIRYIDIQNFRCLEDFKWQPLPGVNCLIGPGDAGKSTVLDAIDACLGARRSVSFSDADFHALDVTKPVSISVTLGELDDGLKSMETYGNYLRSFDADLGEIDDEPEAVSKPC
jgi:DNA repair exonuclease SbcCD ATPase subunit